MLPVLNSNDVTPAHIQSLIDSDVAENQMLEYKSELPSRQSDQKREFLYDIAAMANGAGGDFVFGIADRKGPDDQSTGIADRLSGMAVSNVQSEIDRLSNLIRDGISPRLTGVTMSPVTCPDGQVLVVRVPRSWIRPHMVTIDAVNKFYRRMGTQKYLMSVDEIRRAFSEQSELSQTIKRWRSHRAELIAHSEGPIPSLSGEVTVLFHMIPASAFIMDDVLRGSWRFPESEKLRVHVPHGITNHRYNADGFLGTVQAGDQVFGYTQVFRSGITEYADGHCSGPVAVGGPPQILGQEIEKQMVSCYRDAITRFRAEGRTEPLYVGFSLIGIRNKLIYATPSQSIFNQNRILIDIFNSPEVLVDITEPEEHPYRKTLLPLADTMWQVAGREGSPFKPNGVWEPFKEYQ
jgi:hypothetical protein